MILMSANKFRLPFSEIREGTEIYVKKDPSKTCGFKFSGIVRKKEHQAILCEGTGYQMFDQADGNSIEGWQIWIKYSEKFSEYLIQNENEEPIASEKWVIEAHE